MAWEDIADEDAKKEAKSKGTKKAPAAKKETAAKVVKGPDEFFTPLSDVEDKFGLNMVLHGREKTGKTTFCMSAIFFEGNEFIPCGYPLYIIDTQFGAKPLKSTIAPEFHDKVMLCEIYEETDDFETDGTASIKKIDEVFEMLSGRSGGTIAIDSFSDVKDWLNEALKVEILKKDKSEYRVQPSDYFWRNSKARAMIYKLIKMPFNLILTSEMKPVYQDAKLSDTGLFEPDWIKKVPYWMDLTLELRKVTIENRLNYFGYVTSSRFQKDTKPMEFKNPTFNKIAEYYMECIEKGVLNAPVRVDSG